ncbi:DNA/RNA non-specific endonuclease [bacterium]|nr:DNA/RNA non-specific endonuclease [bacterium]
MNDWLVRSIKIGVLLCIITFSALNGIQGHAAEIDYLKLIDTRENLLNEHLKAGNPEVKTVQVLVRNAYVIRYNELYGIPNWVGYHICPEYLNTPTRKSKFSRFRSDPAIEYPVHSDDYLGLFRSIGFARGHLAPYKILGGDRDDDGIVANYEDKTQSDAEDELTVFQGNFMSNIAPQHHEAINGPGGLWFKVERWIQDEIVRDDKQDVWIYAGCIVYDTKHMQKVGPQTDIVVPDMFYKIVYKYSGTSNVPDVLAFLFPHFKSKHDVIQKEFKEYAVPVNYVESLTGLNFFSSVGEEDQERIESGVDYEPWKKYL